MHTHNQLTQRQHMYSVSAACTGACPLTRPARAVSTVYWYFLMKVWWNSCMRASISLSSGVCGRIVVLRRESGRDVTRAQVSSRRDVTRAQVSRGRDVTSAQVNSWWPLVAGRGVGSYRKAILSDTHVNPKPGPMCLIIRPFKCHGNKW